MKTLSWVVRTLLVTRNIAFFTLQNIQYPKKSLLRSTKNLFRSVGEGFDWVIVGRRRRVHSERDCEWMPLHTAVLRRIQRRDSQFTRRKRRVRERLGMWLWCGDVEGGRNCWKNFTHCAGSRRWMLPGASQSRKSFRSWWMELCRGRQRVTEGGEPLVNRSLWFTRAQRCVCKRRKPFGSWRSRVSTVACTAAEWGYLLGGGWLELLKAGRRLVLWLELFRGSAERWDSLRVTSLL